MFSYYELKRATGSGSDPYHDNLKDKSFEAESSELLSDSGESIEPAVVEFDPLMYPCDLNEQTRNRFNDYLLDKRDPKVIPAGDYITRYLEKFTIKHEVHVYGNLADIHDKTKSNEWLKYLLVPQFADRIFDVGRHVLPVYDAQGQITHYFTFTTNKKIIVRKDNYGNIVCDVVSQKTLGDELMVMYI